MNREAFATHKREIKARCLSRTLELIARPLHPSPDEMCDWVCGLTHEQWADTAIVANATHDCGVTHEAPSEDTRMEVVNYFTHRAVHAERVQDRLARELAARASGRRHLELVP